MFAILCFGFAKLPPLSLRNAPKGAAFPSLWLFLLYRFNIDVLFILVSKAPINHIQSEQWPTPTRWAMEPPLCSPQSPASWVSTARFVGFQVLHYSGWVYAHCSRGAAHIFALVAHSVSWLYMQCVPSRSRSLLFTCIVGLFGKMRVFFNICTWPIKSF